MYHQLVTGMVGYNHGGIKREELQVIRHLGCQYHFAACAKRFFSRDPFAPSRIFRYPGDPRLERGFPDARYSPIPCTLLVYWLIALRLFAHRPLTLLLCKLVFDTWPINCLLVVNLCTYLELYRSAATRAVVLGYSLLPKCGLSCWNIDLTCWSNVCELHWIFVFFLNFTHVVMLIIS